MSDKVFISAQELLEASFALAAKIVADEYRPDMLIGIWRGGAPVGIAVHEFMVCKGLNPLHAALQAVSYSGIEQQAETIEIHGLDSVVERLKPAASVLLVDDVFDSGRTLDAIIRELNGRAADKAPEIIRVACPWYKPAQRAVALEPDYYLHTTGSWLVFPHELEGLSREEIRSGKPGVADIVLK